MEAGEPNYSGVLRTPLPRQPRNRTKAHGVLVVEDEAFVRQVTCEVLTSAGYHVFKACCGADALSIFRQQSNSIQLLLTDIVLPGQSGQALAEQLCEFKPGLKALLVSGYPQNGATPQKPAGMGFLAKPFCSETLLNKVRQVLRVEEDARLAVSDG